MVKVTDENDYISALVNGERHYTDGKQHFIERENSLLEYIGPLSEAHADVIAAFLTDEPLTENQECDCLVCGECAQGGEY